MKTRKLRKNKRQKGGQLRSVPVSTRPVPRPVPRPVLRPVPRPSPRPSPRPAPAPGSNRLHLLTRIVGSNPVGFGGDGGPAISANLYYPSNVAVDRSGNVYIADKWNHRIRRVAASTGIITTVAGNGNGGLSGDGGPAINARIEYPSGIVIDRSGNLLIADTQNHRIRRVALNTGIITTVVGTIEGFSGDGSSATTAKLSFPSGLALDSSGNMYIGDTNNNRIRRVDAVTNNITTIAGYGWHILGDEIGGFNGDNKPATTARLNNPTEVVVDRNRNVFISDFYNHRIRRVDASGTITTVAGDGSTDSSVSMPYPMGLAIDNNNLYMANGTLRRLSLRTGIINVVTGYSNTTFPVNSMVFDSSGNMIIAHIGNNSISKISGPFM